MSEKKDITVIAGIKPCEECDEALDERDQADREFYLKVAQDFNFRFSA